MSREATIWILEAWFGGSLVGGIMSIAFSIMISKMQQ